MVWRAIYQPLLVLVLLWAFDPVWAVALAMIVLLSNGEGIFWDVPSLRD